ncbi:Hypothetical protein FKW44_015806 [Caligus rogercresseyi]|uniref:Uncharacterized protein n=1 Tax=Caligus rogercresseyi TaxID=217165 RepID=A0A7T8K0P6_CALRO|nr:Hypothetical protein FKW44_015806 [Caligus rogercresseyi]
MTLNIISPEANTIGVAVAEGDLSEDEKSLAQPQAEPEPPSKVIAGLVLHQSHCNLLKILGLKLRASTKLEA